MKRIALAAAISLATLTVVAYSTMDCRTPSANATITVPLSWPMPPTTTTRNALTMMFVFSGLTRGAPPPDPPEEHPAASIVIALPAAERERP